MNYDEWKCSQCTFLNRSTSTVCGTCERCEICHNISPNSPSGFCPTCYQHNNKLFNHNNNTTSITIHLHSQNQLLNNDKTSNEYKCQLKTCTKVYKTKGNLNRHLKDFHRLNSNLTPIPNNIEENNDIKCNESKREKITASDLRKDSVLKSYRNDSKADDKKTKQVAHYFSLEIAAYIYQFVKPSVSIAALKQSCNDRKNLRMVPRITNLSKHKIIDNTLIGKFKDTMLDKFNNDSKYKALLTSNPSKLELEMTENKVTCVWLRTEDAKRAKKQCKMVQTLNFPNNYTAFARLFYRCFKDAAQEFIWNDDNNTPEFEKYLNEKQRETNIQSNTNNYVDTLPIQSSPNDEGNENNKQLIGVNYVLKLPDVNYDHNAPTEPVQGNEKINESDNNVSSVLQCTGKHALYDHPNHCYNSTFDCAKCKTTFGGNGFILYFTCKKCGYCLCDSCNKQQQTSDDLTWNQSDNNYNEKMNFKGYTQTTDSFGGKKRKRENIKNENVNTDEPQNKKPKPNESGVLDNNNKENRKDWNNINNINNGNESTIQMICPGCGQKLKGPQDVVNVHVYECTRN